MARELAAVSSSADAVPVDRVSATAPAPTHFHHWPHDRLGFALSQSFIRARPTQWFQFGRPDFGSSTPRSGRLRRSKSVRALLHRRHIRTSKTGLAGKCVTPSTIRSCEAAPMAGKTGSDLEELRALLAEVKALREDVEHKGAELRSGWGVERGQVEGRASRSQSLPLYRAARARPHRPAIPARRAGALFARPQRKPRRAGARYAHCDAQASDRRIGRGLSGAGLAKAGAAELEAEADRLFGKRQKGGPRARVMATLPPEAATEPGLVDNLVAAGMDCARINCAHDDPEMWGQMVEHVREAAARLERPAGS